MTLGKLARGLGFAAACALAAMAWALAQGFPTTPTGSVAPAGNHPPTLRLPVDDVRVRAGERVVVAVEALDVDELADGALEDVLLSLALAPDVAPDWLRGGAWSAGPSARPRVELAFEPPLGAAPGRHAVEAGATDARGLTTLGTFDVVVLPPLCASPNFNDGGTCRACPENQVPDRTGQGCAPCGTGTERPAGTAECVACEPGLSSEAGGFCSCGPSGVLEDGRCVECPPNMAGVPGGGWCDGCPVGTQRPAGAPACEGAPRISRKSALAESTPVTLVASLVNGSASLSEDAGRVDVQLSLVPMPSAGLYTGCRVRLAAGSEATSADVTFQNQKKLRLENDWSAQAGLMSVVDDALVEGDETLVVEGHCTSSRNGADPSHADLVLQPLTLTIRDNDAAKPMALSVSPESIGESLGGQAVTVTATLEAPASAPADVALSLGRGAYSVAGARTINIQAGESHGSTELLVTPKDDGNATDDAVAVKGSASGYTVTETRLTIREPVVVEGVDVSGLGVRLSVSPTAIREGTRGAHRVGAVLTGVPVPAVDVAMVLAVGGTATEGASHDYVFKGDDDWRKLTVAANDAHLSAGTSVTVSALADGVEDGDETVTLSIGQVTWGATVVKLPEPATALLTITEAWDVPQAPSGLTVVPAPGDERHGLDLAWEAVSAVPSVDGYVVRHRAVSDPLGAWADSQPQPGLAHALTALAAGTRYEVRVRADSAAGRGAESGSVYARTADGDCTVGAPRVVTPTGTRSATELEVSWEAATCAASTTLAHYRVRHREDPDAEGVDNPWVEETSSTLTATLVGLTPDTAYVVEVRAVATGGDNGPWSATGRGRTGLDARLPPRVAAPVVVAHADHGDERLDASWTRVEWTDGNGVAQPITEYQYRHRPAGGDWTTPTDARATAAEATAMTRTIAGLAFGTWHEVQVRGVNRMLGVAYPGKWSEPGRGRTWGVPDRVEEPAAYGTGSTVEVVWDAPDDGGSPINDYDVEYKGNSGGWTTHPYTGCAMDGCATETSIKTAAGKVRVRAGNAVGMGRWSPTAKVRTLKPLRVSFSVSSVTVPEGRSAQVGLRLHSTADRAVSVPLTKAGAVGAIRLDRAPGSAVAFGLGERERTFDVVALSDVDAGDEEVTLGLGPLPDGVLAGSPSSLAVTVEDDDSVNGAPTFGEGMAATRTVAEDAPEGTAVGLPVAATDPENDPLTYSLTAGSAPFVIDAATGQLRVGTDAQFDFEGGPSSYALTIEVSDGKDGAGQPDMASDAAIAVTVEITDVAEAPSAPAAPTLGLGFRSLPVVWAAPPNSGPPVNGYVISYRSAGAPLWAGVPIDGTDTETEIQSLRPGAAYEVRVRAVNDEGAGPWSGLAEANTWPSAVIAASTEQPVIGVGNVAAPVTLTATVEAAEGQLEGRWRRSGRDRVTQPLSESLALASGQAETLSVSSSAPGEWLHSIEVVHRLGGREATLHQGVEVEWLPSVVLDVEPDAVSEDGGPQEVAVTATLTGTAVTGKAKRVSVAVAGGTAAAGDDFVPVTGFEIAIPGGARSAQGTFTLTPVADGSSDHGETVSVSGTAVQTGTALPVTGAAVVINEAVATLRVEPPLNGRVAGVDEGGATVIDCGSDCSETLAIGAVLTLTATADDGHGFTGWTGGCSGTSPCTVTMDADRTVGAEFAALPGRPDAPSLSPTGHDALQVTWSAPSVTGTGIEKYGLRHRVPGGGTWTEATFGKATSAVIGSLASGTRYEVQVRAVAKEGPGPWSASGEAVTLPSVAVRVDDALPVIGADGAAASVTLTAAATAAEGDLTGRWVQRLNGKLVTVNGEPFTMASGAERSAAFRHDAPGLRAYGLMVAHGPNLGLGEVGETLEVRWLPSVVLSAAPAGVAEDGGPETVTVTARLTGSAVEDVAKRVTVEVGGGTATEGSDFAAVDDFEIALGAGVAAASGTFKLAPVEDTDQEGSETVAVGGGATQDGIALPVVGATVAIEDAVRHSLTVSTPANGRITGPGINCGGAQGKTCTATYPEGTAVTLRAVADSGHLLRGWSGDCSGAGDCALTMSADRSVGAAFAAARTLTVAKSAKGKVTGTVGADQVIDCGDDCSETAIDGTVVALLASAAEGHRFDTWGGACASQATANCSVTLDADKSVSVAFAAGPVAGRCDENVVDGCAAGTLNEAAFEDKASHHFWRCDGTNGGPDSPKCSKAKAGCAAGSLGWSVGGLGCSGTVAAAASGHLAPVTDGDDPTRGSASFKCDDSVWKEQTEASFCSVDLRCGASVNACLPSGVDLRDPTQTKAKAGACAATEAARCLNGTLYRNRDDIPLRNGSCGTQVNQCASGTLQTLNDSSKAYRWRCLGVDAEDRWSCLGIDGSNQWTCAYGGRSKSCALPIDATDDLTCGNGIVTQTASDADCFACKPGYEAHNGACVTPCGTNEKRDGSGNCVCKAGYHESGGACVGDPYCPSSREENQCGPTGARFIDLNDTVVHAKCAKTRAARCTAGTSYAANDYDVAPQHGACGSSINRCSIGNPENETQNSSSYLWDCEGYAGSKNWSCEGRDGYRKWQCEHGEKTASCRVPTGDPEIGKDISCGEAVKANTANCISCKAGYVRSGDSCVEDTVTLTVKVDPAGAGTVSGTLACTNECVKTFGPNDPKTVNLSVTPMTGYACSFASSGGNTVSFTLGADRTETVSCNCAAGYHMHEGICVPDPFCPTPRTENQCGPGSAMSIDVGDTVVHGKRNATQEDGCMAGKYFVDSSQHVAAKHGMCGSSINTCANEVASKNETETISAYRWDCGGKAGVRDYWGCKGTDGHRLWDCESGLKTKRCQLPVTGKEIGTHDAGGTTVLATTANCISCKPGYALDGRSCVRVSTLTVKVSPANKGTVSGTLRCTGTCTKQFGPQDGKAVSLTVASADGYACSFSSNGQTSLSFTMTTADRTETVNCNCAAGHHLHNGNCVPDPFCPTPLTENQCGPDSSTSIDVEDTVVHGKRAATKAKGCIAGKFVDVKDAAPEHGQCGSAANTCAFGTESNMAQTTSAYHWDCEGKAGVRDYWKCLGTDGHRLWDCQSGLKTKRCQLPETGKETGTHDQGGTTVPATTANCISCKPGYERKGDSCKLALKADAGGTNGSYRAQPMRLTLPFGGWVNIFSAAVSASATGGVSPYKFQWSGPSVGDAARVTYFFPGNQVFPVFRTVTVTDSATPAATDTATAKINAPATSAAAGNSEEGFAFEVPLGGELLFIWGGEGDVTARSDNAEVVRVNTSSPAVRVAGVGLGRTHVIVKTADEEIWLPVAVR